MKIASRRTTRFDLGRSAWLALASVPLLAGLCAAQNGYEKVKLVSDVHGAAHHTDPRLVNAWGLVTTPGLVWVADNGTGLSTVYLAQGFPIPFAIHIPDATGGFDSAPTGMVFNPSPAFVIAHGGIARPSRFLFASEDGTISGWNPVVSLTRAIVAVDNSAGDAVYKGLARAHTQDGERLYATDFHNGKVDVFDAGFAPVHHAGAFEDSNLPAHFAPFGIRSIDDRIFVTYAKQKPPDNDDDEASPGNGFIDVFHKNGSLIGRFASHGSLNSPWGLARASEHFGTFSHALLVGNFGDGKISAFDIDTGAFLGLLEDENHHSIAIDGLWGLDFGVHHDGDQDEHDGPRLYFTAGPDDENHGLMGFIRPDH